MHRTLPFALLFVVVLTSVAGAQEIDHLAELEALIKECNKAAREGAQLQRASRRFAQRQLGQLLDDRPNMKGIVPKDHPIREWVLEKFRTGDSGRRVYWDRQQPFSRSAAEHQAGQVHYLACVRITDDKKVSGRDKWYMLVFEMENMQNSKKFEAITSLVGSNQIDREHFIESCINLEFEANARTQQIFNKTPLPGVTPENAPNYVSKMADEHDLPRYMEFLKTLGPDRYNPREYFGAYFDKWTAYQESQLAADEQRENAGPGEAVNLDGKHYLVPATTSTRKIVIDGGTTTISGNRITIEGGKTVITQ